jgi:hypothetical protein
MTGISIWSIIITLLFIVLFIIPPIKVGLSSSVAGWSKFKWLLLSLCFSWIGFVTYYNLNIASRGYNSRK